jgi:hypothetical protein
MTVETTTHTHISTRNTTGQACEFHRDLTGWVWANDGRRISIRFLSAVVDRLSRKAGASVVFYTPGKQR